MLLPVPDVYPGQLLRLDYEEVLRVLLLGGLVKLNDAAITVSPSIIITLKVTRSLSSSFWAMETSGREAIGMARHGKHGIKGGRCQDERKSGINGIGMFGPYVPPSKPRSRVVLHSSHFLL